LYAYLAHPEWLWLLTLLPLALLRVVVGRARRRRDWVALGQGGRPPGDGSFGWLVAAAWFVVALAQPRWGRSDRSPLPPGHDVVLAVDVSRSMGAEDAVPDRLGLAVEAAGSLVEALGRVPGDRVAVVAFAGKGVLRCPLTTNLGAAIEAMRNLRPGEVRPGGTDLAAALDAAREAFDEHDRAEGRTVVVFSDGEDHPGAWPPALERLREAGVIVHSVAVGDAAQGHPVPVQGGPGAGPESNFEPLTYQGGPVLSRRSDKALEAIATATGGAFIPLGLSTTDLGRLYRDRIEPVARARRDGELDPEPAERFGLFLLAGLATGLVACRPGRRRPLPGRGWLPVAAIAVVVLVAAAGESAVGLVASGRAAFAGGRFAEALDAFQRAVSAAPADAVPRYDVAAALFQLGRYDEALAWYEDARTRADAALRTKIDYALGHTTLALGRLAESLAHYDDCLASTATGGSLDEVRRRAAANRKFVEDLARRAPNAPEGDQNPAQAPDADRPRGGDDRGADTPKGDDRGEEGGAGGPAGAESEATAPSGRRGPGGAGGGGPAPPRAGTPEGRLARALENIREARRRRVDEPDPAEVSRDLKDW
jgi:Ca-activated chloride channel family protein